MSSIKSIALVVSLFLAARAHLCQYTIQLRPSDRHQWRPFDAHVVMNLDFGDKLETVRTFRPIPISPGNWWSFDALPSGNVDELQRVTFLYTSVNSPDDKFSLQRLSVGQKRFRNRRIYYRTFYLDAPEWLEQNETYIGVPERQDDADVVCH